LMNGGITAESELGKAVTENLMQFSLGGASQMKKAPQTMTLYSMDHFMPKMDGVEAVKIIREMGYTQPIVALTANAVTGQEEMFLANGFDDFIENHINDM